MMNRGNMGRQIATAPASRPTMPVQAQIPTVTGIARAQQVAAPQAAVMRMAKGGKAKKMDGCCMKGHTKGKMC